MQSASFVRSWPSLIRKNKQNGQALIYGLFVLIGSLAGLFFLFNVGQLVQEKTKLVNTADAVAYSGGVMNARALNFEAYTNRAMVANTVAIAQLVSLSSWIQYANNLATYGYAVDNPKFVAFYPSYFVAMEAGPYLQQDLNDSGALERLATGSDDIIQALKAAQATAYGGLIPARQQVMNDVANANYRDDGTISVDLLPSAVTALSSFITHYSDDERTRFAEVAKVSANRDPFIPRRSWTMPGLWADCAGATPRVDWMDRRGGTELVSFDEWKAVDTLSVKEWVPKNKTDVLCQAISEIPAGWGSQSAADNPSFDPDPTHYDYSMLINPGSTGMAVLTSDSWDYSGLPSFYDLSEDALKQADPRMQFAIRLRRDKSQTVTSEGRSLIRNTPRLNAYQAQPAGGDDFVAVSTSEVYFERPDDYRENVYGRSRGKATEIGSLFNPFWQVRLVQSDTNVRAAQALQGVILP
jgi:hypothetical protein